MQGFSKQQYFALLIAEFTYQEWTTLLIRDHQWWVRTCSASRLCDRRKVWTSLDISGQALSLTVAIKWEPGFIVQTMQMVITRLGVYVNVYHQLPLCVSVLVRSRHSAHQHEISRVVRWSCISFRLLGPLTLSRRNNSELGYWICSCLWIRANQ